MGRKDKSSKAAEKKKERLAMERKMNERLKIVAVANEQKDPLESLPSFKSYKMKDGTTATLTTERVTNLDDDTKVWIMDLITRNMKALYEESSWGWNLKNKQEEMFEDSAWFLIARVDDKPIAYSHFRFDMDYDDEVLYVYEIQMEESFRRKGLGKFMMQVLELLAFKADMRKIMLTVFKHNASATKFFKTNLKFEIDETCPIDSVYEQFDYEIVSKFNKRKLAKEAQSENNAGAANNATATVS